MTEDDLPVPGSLEPQGWAAAQETFLRCGPKLTTALAVMLRSHADAEDAVREALFRLAKSLPTIRDRSPQALDAWLRKTAVRVALAERRRTRRWILGGLPDELSEMWRAASKRAALSLSPDEQAAAGEALQFVASLPGMQRTAYVMRHALDLTVAKIAEAMGCSEGNVYTHLKRAQDAIDKKFAAPDKAPQQSKTRILGRGRGE
ncbi:RNA polymerase sigma factor [Umezawaea sp. Da 62-37]|uniref:RNA polymerase sigma factor n=1 Tax=Umezawaea sp. Da 62-37 TaxID=3075927 RepID=UPI0028F743D9|nr:RNA polymerase sigma factor [Umezawaea sp. Da 62-37]WNV84911.1 RNA polymerase sigma factor [Umezawaea sp. Da 62-37]